MKWDETEETVLDMAKKLRTYADAVHGPTHARIAALETHMRKLEDKIEENHKELREDILQISAVQYRTTRDAVISIHKMIRELETQGVVSKTHSPFNSPIWPVRKSDGGWRLTLDYRALNEVTPPLSAAVPDMLELQYELESKAAKWPQFSFTWREVQYTWNRLPQEWKHSPTICHGLIQAALEKGEAPEHLQYIDDITVWGNTAMEVFEKGEKIIHILLKAGFAIKKSKVKGPAREIQFLGVKWHDGRRQIPTEIIHKITAMCPPTNKKETQAFLGAIGFWMMHIPEYNQIVSPLYLVTHKKMISTGALNSNKPLPRSSRRSLMQ
ncbi:hypothetical protein DUI87_02955 [Hirundo rustica rustica]|uniref:ribonuclease H n=1 Tax=Hirundo rustica rustica TaxID=333673 RepID=A0A3M0L9V1_HIRRU|nr:hypothetical protein DUI87_02955 [Hirundo rustica rustica]